MGAGLEFLDDAGSFLDAAGELLAAEPVAVTVLATVSERMRRDQAAGRAAPSGFPVWWVVEREAGRVVGAGMRTAPEPPHAVYLVGMSVRGAEELAQALHARGERVSVVGGPLALAESFAAQAAALRGSVPRVEQRTTLFVLGELRAPQAVPGRLRAARHDEVDLAVRWFSAFGPEAARQAGQAEPHPAEHVDREAMLRRIDDGTVWVWEDGSGSVVHLSGASRPMFGVARIGPVYTPPEHRGHGYAAATVATLSRRLLDEGAQVCLFADQANPASTALYDRLGFRPLTEHGQVVIG